MDTLIKLDTLIFNFLNQDIANPLFDVFLPFWTDFQKEPLFLYLFLPLLLGFIIKTKNWNVLKVLVIAAIATLIVDNINHFFVKGFFERSRPVDGILRIAKQGNFSFPSSHAVDAFCFATILALAYPKRKWIFLFLASLTCLSRIYGGVHFPSDVIVGGIIGALFAYAFFKLIVLRIPFIRVTFIFVLPLTAFAEWKDPTGGKPFGDWIWEDQFKPTLVKSVDKTGLTILGTGAASSLVVHEYDKKINRYNEKHPVLLGHDEAEYLGKLGNGVFGVGLALTQIYFDQENGLRHSRAILLTSLSHVSVAALVRRNRPGNRSDFLPFPSAFPSGHTSSAFATAGALAYSYGWKAGVPAYGVATAIAISRLREARHWTSDLVGGAFLGTFWARASFNADEPNEKSVLVVPAPVADGMMLTAIKFF